MRHEFTPEQINRFEQKIDRSGGDDACWPFTACIGNAGYGQLTINKRGMLAHRVAYMIYVGEIPRDKPHILHSCDNRPCCNPAHLRAGTNADNVNDRVTRGRCGDHRGIANGKARLTEDDVHAIRREISMGAMGISIAAKYGIAPAHVSLIKRKKAWGHID